MKVVSLNISFFLSKAHIRPVKKKLNLIAPETHTALPYMQ